MLFALLKYQLKLSNKGYLKCDMFTAGQLLNNLCIEFNVQLVQVQ